MAIKKITCVGAGLIGHSWATLFALKGFPVMLEDLGERKLEDAIRSIKESLDFLEEKNVIGEREADKALDRIGFTTSLAEAVEDADYVQESIYERYEDKRRIFREMDERAPEDAVLASSSSGLLMTEIQKVTKKPGRCIIAHPWNPPLLMPLVELVPGEGTSRSTVGITYKLMRDLGKMPVTLKREVPGFIGNRLQAALWREAISLVERGVASVEDVDKALYAGPGIRWAFMGAHTTLHLGGGRGGIRGFITHIGPTYSGMWRDMDCWSEIPPSAAEKVIEGVEAIGRVRESSMEELARWRDEKLIEIIKVVYGGS